MARKKSWVQKVMKTSNAMDLEDGVFTKDNPLDIARSLKSSVESSNRTKGTKFSSAMSMLNFHINRSGSNLSDERRQVLEGSKDALRSIFGKKK